MVSAAVTCRSFGHSPLRLLVTWIIGYLSPLGRPGCQGTSLVAGMTCQNLLPSVLWPGLHWRSSPSQPSLPTPSGPCVCASLLSCVQIFVTPQTIAHKAALSMGIPQARIPNSFCLSGHSFKLLISSHNHLSTKLVTASYYNCFSTLIKYSSPVIPVLSPRPSELSFFTFFQSSSESCHFKNTAFFSCPLLFCLKGKTSFLKDWNYYARCHWSLMIWQVDFTINT